MAKQKLSAVIIADNEEAHIARCIGSLRDVADDILVVDSFSQDRTVEIAENLGARVIQNVFEGHIQQKNFAKDKAQYDFVLSLDADEALSDELIESIRTEKLDGFPCSGYYMNRRNFVGKLAVTGCGWYPDRKLRLWNRNDGQWQGINPHDRFQLKRGIGLLKGELKGDLLHYSYPNNKAVFKKSLQYGKIGAHYCKTLPWPKLLLKLIFSPPFKFVRNYFFKRGFLFGWTGFVICLSQMVEGFTKYGMGAVNKGARD